MIKEYLATHLPPVMATVNGVTLNYTDGYGAAPDRQTPISKALPYDAVVNRFNLEILKTPGDLSIEDGDLALTKDNDFKLGDTVYNGLFRLVQDWRFNSPHMRFMFDTAELMREHRVSLDEKMNKAAEAQAARFNIKNFLKPDPIFHSEFWGVCDEQGVAEFGRATYGGCLVLLLSSSLLRFRDDIDASKDDWEKASPLFGGCSFGQVIVAAANGFRHEDEWAKARLPNSKQKASQKILIAALRGRQASILQTPARSAEILDLLSNGGDFECLATNFFAFAHNVAARIRSALKT